MAKTEQKLVILDLENLTYEAEITGEMVISQIKMCSDLLKVVIYSLHGG